MSLITRSLHSRTLTSFLQALKLDKHLFKNYSQPSLLLNMNEAIIKCHKDNERFEVSLRYVNPDLNVDRRFNFSRKLDEPISKFFHRVQWSINAYATKKLKRKNKNNSIEDNEATVTDYLKDKSIMFVKNGCAIDEDLTFKNIFKNLDDIKLVVFDTEYTLKQNIPLITKINLPSSILAGFPTYPSKFETEYVDRSKSIFQWYKGTCAKSNSPWTLIGEGYFYIPSTSDIAHLLKISCVPSDGTQTGPTTELVSTTTVQCGPGPCPFETRHAFTKEKLSGKSFRVASYNILANTYSETDISKNVLYPYCPEYALSMDYRKLLILKELIGYNADIICLQEVDTSVYENDLLPFLGSINYDSIYNAKNNMREGLAIFYNKERFDKLDCKYSILSQDTDSDEFKTVWSQIENTSAKVTFSNRSTIIQTVVLRSKENSEILIVGNTHLYFLPNADHIRLLQAYYGLTYIKKYAKDIKEQNPECNVSMLYCGDFNSAPENGVYQLMTQKYVPEDHPDWKSNPVEEVQNVSLKHDLNFSSACGAPEYTNYTATFSGCLDYIFYQTDHLGVKQVIPMPSTEELSLHTGLPSVVFPSDHISLCADLKWLK